MAPEPDQRRPLSAPQPALPGFHSRYSPLREAERHLDAVLAGKKPAIVFILGGGLNYLAAAAARRYPHAVRVSLQPCDDFCGKEVCSAEYSWNPASGAPLRTVIRSALASGRMAGGVSVVEWPPVVARFQHESDSMRSILLRCLNEESANSATTGFWASRWLRNSVRFAGAVAEGASLTTGTGPLILACAGPSLTETLQGIRAVRDTVCLWALASAVPALLRAGIRPDLAISTDPGYWNGYHARAAFDAGIPLAMTPSSFSPSVILEKALVLALDTGMSFERGAVEAAGVPSMSAEPSGSAAGTALSLALRSTTGLVALAGYDLAARDMEDHARPYPFDILDTLRESRLRPGHSARTERVLEGFTLASGNWRCSRPFSTYASTIATPEADIGRVLRLGDSPVETRIPRGRLDALAGASGSLPAVGGCGQPAAAASGMRRASLVAMLDRLTEEAIASARKAIQAGGPVPYDAALLFKALAPRSSAAFIADAARGEARARDLETAAADARLSAIELSEVCA